MFNLESFINSSVDILLYWSNESGFLTRDDRRTDHGRPINHPNPHQHIYKPNPAGGTPIRDPSGQPLPEWSNK